LPLCSLSRFRRLRPFRRPDVRLDGGLPLFGREADRPLEPILVHPMQQILVRLLCIEAEDGINAAIGTERRITVIYPFHDPVKRIFFEAVETAADLGVSEHRSVPTTLFVQRD